MNMGKLYTTLNKIREHHPCKDGWEKLLDHLNKTKADDEPLSFFTILESNGLEDTLWCLRAAPEEWMPNCRMYAVWCAKQIEHLFIDQRSKDALVAAQNHALGKATDEELAAASAASWASAWEAARAAQKEMFIKMCQGTAPWQLGEK